MIRPLVLLVSLAVIINPGIALAVVDNTALPGTGATSTTTLSGAAAPDGASAATLGS